MGNESKQSRVRMHTEIEYCSNCLELQVKLLQEKLVALEGEKVTVENEPKELKNRAENVDKGADNIGKHIRFVEGETQKNIAPSTPGKISGIIRRDDENDGLIGQKRKRDCNLVCSDSYDDDLPLSYKKQSTDNVPKASGMSIIRRKKAQRSLWECANQMRADFMKDDELCLEALCALYGQQTPDEKRGKYTAHPNQRGFNQLDAKRGSELAEFLTDGEGNLIKSVKELLEHDLHGVKTCREMALYYCNQLFAIYINEEDPLFLP